MLVTVINLITGQSVAGSKKKIASYLNIPVSRLNLYKRNKIIVANDFAISFNYQRFKIVTGNKERFVKMLEEKRLSKQISIKENNQYSKVV